MQRIWALPVALLMLTCSWQNTLTLLLEAETCCITVCCEEEDACRDDSMNGQCISKCFCCCYVMPSQEKIVMIERHSRFMAGYSSMPLTSFVNDVFRPPEYI